MSWRRRPRWLTIDSISGTFVVIVALVLGVLVTLGSLGWPPASDSELPFPGVERDVVRERQVALDALSGDPVASDHFRTPGAVVLLFPILVFPPSHLTWIAALIGVASVVVLILGSVELAGRRALALAIFVPLSASFAQGTFHGSLFVVVAGLVCWGWVALVRRRDILAGVMLGIAALVRLWPLLLLVPIAVHRRRTVVVSAGVTFLGLNVLGLALPGISVASVMDSAAMSSDRWIAASHNGSIAGLLPFTGTLAAASGFALAMVIWALGFRRIRTLHGRLSWSLPAAILASPLAWLPYLLCLAPIAAMYGNRRWSRVALLALGALLAVGTATLPDWLLIPMATALVWLIVGVERDPTMAMSSQVALASRR